MIIILIFLSILCLINNSSGSNSDVTLVPIASIDQWPTTSPSNVRYAFDANSSTSWTSWPCTAGGWRNNALFNPLLNQCSLGSCTGSCDATLVGATDSSPYVAGHAYMNHAEGESWATFPIPNAPVNAVNIYIRGGWPVNTTLYVVSSTGDEFEVAALNPVVTYQDLTFQSPISLVSALKLRTATIDGKMRGNCYAGTGDCKSLMVTEIAIQTKSCFEQLTVQFGDTYILKKLRIDFSGASSAYFSTSIDGKNYRNATSLNKYVTGRGFRDVAIANVTAKYARLRFYTSTSSLWNKVYVKDAYFYGKLASSSTNCPNKCSGRGVCPTGSTVCDCSGTNYTGDDCSYLKCPLPCVHGACVAGACSCNSTYTGASCNISVCPHDCWGHGTCVGGICQCYPAYGGSHCRQFKFHAVSSHMNTTRYYTDYVAEMNNRTVTRKPYKTTFYSKQDKAAAACPPSAPFLCSDGVSCAVSLGACALRAKTEGSFNWNAKSFLATSLPVNRTLSSSASSASYLMADGSESTFWQSGFCYPTGYMSYPTVNILYGACAAGRCSSGSSSSSSTWSQATDAYLNTGAGVSLVSGLAYLRVSLSAASTLVAVSARASVSGVSVVGITASGGKVALGTLTSSYALTNIPIVANATFIAIQLQATSSFSVLELAARSSACSEFATVDFGAVQAISVLRVRHYAGSAYVSQTTYEASSDGVDWTVVRSGIPSQLVAALETEFNPLLSARYLRVRHTLREGVAAKVFVWEVSAWGEEGKNGKPPDATMNNVSFKDLLGVNGIWAWGGQGWSNLAYSGWGPLRYSVFASHGRNYHNWNWDVKDPDNLPNFEAMSCGNGTDTQWWLDWDWEYAGWNSAGLEVEVSLQFYPSMFALKSFNDPYRAGYNYGYLFAKHFGPTQGTNLVATIEVGNEPWGYADPGLYKSVLSGLAKGVKDADPLMRVLPAAFAGANDTLLHLSPSHLAYLDALNVHAYSWAMTTRGRTGVHPESNLSTLHDVNWILRFRDANAPGLPVYLTEWGWDSAGGGETCGPPPDRAGQGDFPECVTEEAQALYAVRGALVLARKGLSRLTWYFYGNTLQTTTTWDSAKGLFGRSGLSSSSAAGFVNKQSLYALEQFVQTLGDSHFLDVVREDSEAYVYLLGDKFGVASHVVAWRPVDANDTDASASVPITFTLSYSPVKAWILGAKTYTAATIPSQSDSLWSMSISQFPTAVALTTVHLNTTCSPPCSTAYGTCHDGKCYCKEGRTGLTCVNVECEQNCWGRGQCQPDGSCSCYQYWGSGGQGDYQRCRPENYLGSGNCRDKPFEYDPGSSCYLSKCKQNCNNHGTCTAAGCVCDVGWSGTTCQTKPCPFNCRSHGTCKNSSCVCPSSSSVYTGSSCEWKATYELRTAATKNCPPSAPFLCSDGVSCAVSLGACALRAKTEGSFNWNAKSFLATSLPVNRTLSSSASSASYLMADGSESTFWQSGFCYPTGYMSYPTVNILFEACAAGRCSSGSSSSSSTWSQATDGDFSSSIIATAVAGIASFRIELSSPTELVAVSARTYTSNVNITGITDTGAVVLLGTVATGYSYSNFLVTSSATFVAIQLQASTSIGLFEVGARSSACSEFATVDFGAVQAISVLRVRHYAGNAYVSQTTYEASSDGVEWTVVRSGIPSQLVAALETEFNPLLSARYLRVRHTLREGVAAKVFVWEVSAWGEEGKNGKPPDATMNNVSFKDLLGVNGIWGWGTNAFSSSLSPGKGPDRYSGMSSYARNYHNWNWDVLDPDTVPPFSDMVARGSTDFGMIPGHSSKLAQDWLNWDNEYTAWRAAGLVVEASIQFTTTMFPQSVFSDPYLAGYNYGYAFAEHFGPTNGTGDVATIEVGNEPWGYADPGLYKSVLSGMAKGVKDADPLMRVLPAAFAGANDTLLHLSPSHLTYLDALNVHAYSWAMTTRGRTGVHPESNLSTLHDVNWILRFRDANAPGLPVYLTEWGWDSAGGGETCGPPPGRVDEDFPECVTEEAQALYAVRGALVLARKGLSRLTWYFYANTVETTTTWDLAKGLFGRSGLTSSSAAGFVNKQSLYALEQFVQTLGDSHFLDVVREDSEAYVYLLGDKFGVASHVVAWRPVDANDTDASASVPITFTLSYIPNAVTVFPVFYSLIDPSHLKLPSVSTANYLWHVNLTAVPLVFSVSSHGLSSLFSRAPSVFPTRFPSRSPTARPMLSPTLRPSRIPTNRPTARPSLSPTASPTRRPSDLPTDRPTRNPTTSPTSRPTASPTPLPTRRPSMSPSSVPSRNPTTTPSSKPTASPTSFPTRRPSSEPTLKPTPVPTLVPTTKPTPLPTNSPSRKPTSEPSLKPSRIPTDSPSRKPTSEPSLKPSRIPTDSPSRKPTSEPSLKPSRIPTTTPTAKPTTTSKPSRLPVSPPTLRPTSQSTTKSPSSLPTLQ